MLNIVLSSLCITFFHKKKLSTVSAGKFFFFYTYRYLPNVTFFWREKVSHLQSSFDLCIHFKTQNIKNASVNTC